MPPYESNPIIISGPDLWGHVMPDDKELYMGLESYKTEIESQLDYGLEWMLMEGKKASRIRTVTNADISRSEQ